MSARHQILCVGTEQLLLETRGQILARRYAVRLLNDAKALQTVANGDLIDLIVLCYTLSDEQYDLARVIAKRRWPAAKILTMQTDLTYETRASEDHAFNAFKGPEAFLARVDEMLSSTAEVKAFS